MGRRYYRRSLLAMAGMGTELERWRADFESATGASFRYFFCPILHIDEDVELAQGHVVPKSLGGVSTVLQRSDVDSNFGTFFEAEAGDAVREGMDGNPLSRIVEGDPAEARKVSRRFKLRLSVGDMQTPIDLDYRTVDDRSGLFAPREDLGAAIGPLDAPTRFRGLLGVELDPRSSILMTCLKATHLAWFRWCGYRYVFSPQGVFIAAVLRYVYQRLITPRCGRDRTKRGSLMSDEVKKEANDCCLQFANLMRPLPSASVEAMPAEIRTGTPESGWCMGLVDGGQVYGYISIVRMGNQYFCVATPSIWDARGWALVDTAANLGLELALGRFDPEAAEFRFDPPRYRTVWRSVDPRNLSMPPMSIRRAAEMAIETGRMSRP